MRKNILFFIPYFLLCFHLSSQTFYREYGSNVINEGAQVIIASPDGDILVGGYRADSALVMKLDPLGNVIWSKRFKPVPNDNMVFHLSITPDNYIVGVGNGLPPAQQRRDGFYFKIDLNGNLIWTHKVNDSRDVYCESLIPLSTTQYILFSNIYDVSSSTWPDVVSARIDASNGNMTWMSPRLDYNNTNSYIDDIYAPAIGKGKSIYTTGRTYINGSDPGGMRVYQSKFDNNGNHLYSNFLLHTYLDYARLYGIDIIYDNDSLVHCYFGDKYGASTNYTAGLIKTDTLGNVIWSKDYDISSSSMEISQKVVKTNFGYTIFGYMTGATEDFFIIATDYNGNALWYKSYGTNSSDEDFRFTVTPVMTYAYGYIYFTGRKTSSGNQNIIVGRTDQTGSISCVTTNNLSIIQTNNPTASTACSMGFPNDVLSFPSTASNILNTGLPDACSNYFVNLGNDTSLCGAFNLTLNAASAGSTSYLWQNGATTSTFNIATTGTYWVVVQFGGCCYSSDTIVISNNQPINFSQNIAICPDDSFQVGNNYYNNPGTYIDTLVSVVGCDSIVTTNLSNNSQANINVSNSNPQICLGGSSTLSANGATSYTWSPSSSLSSTTGTPVTATPTSATTYTVIGTTPSGCADTALITVTISILSLDPGNTQNICVGDSAQLSAGGNATTYTWSPSNSLLNSNTQNPIAFPSTTTTYTVNGTNALGCMGIDSQTVVVFPLPSTPTISVNGNTLSSNNAIGNQWYLNGNPISGATSQFYTAIQSGFYQVMVTDVNGCTSISAAYNFSYNGIEENNSEINFSISPNPNDGNFYLDILVANPQKIKIFITNELGQQLMNEEKIKINRELKKKFNFKELPKGIYFIYIQSEKTRVVQKFMIE